MRKITITVDDVTVALRKESVDRNNTGSASFRASTTMSLSARRAWIEISSLDSILAGVNVALRKESVDRNATFRLILSPLALSLSARRAWIEMPWGAGGCGPPGVALRKESVDRNTYKRTSDGHYLVALRKESVDRNISPHSISCMTLTVALRKESVDRNLAVWAVEHAYQRRSPQGERG